MATLVATMVVTSRAVRGPGRMRAGSTSLAGLPSGSGHPETEVGILSEGAGEALVEPADRGERGAAIRHVRRDPTGIFEAAHVAFPVRRLAVRGQRDAHPSL